MKAITQKEFDSLPVNEYGFKECPGYTDYSQIKSFGERCSFGEGCRFGQGCRFGHWCSFGEGCSFGEVCRFGEECRFEGISKYIGKYPFKAWIGSGSRLGSKTYLFNLKEGMYVRCGCFLGSVKEFEKAVAQEHGEDSSYLKILKVFVDEFEKENQKQK